MRHRLLFIVASLTILLLQGCFKDNGSYDYLELNPPKWLINLSNDNINIYCRGGEEAHFKGSAYFVWEGSEADIERRKSEVRYEWRFKDKVLSTNLDDVIPTQELLDRLGLKAVYEHILNVDIKEAKRLLGATSDGRCSLRVEGC